MRARGRSCWMLVTVVSLSISVAACGEPELNDRAKNTQGSGEPTGSSGSPAPGIPPDLPSGGTPPG